MTPRSTRWPPSGSDRSTGGRNSRPRAWRLRSRGQFPAGGSAGFVHDQLKIVTKEIHHPNKLGGEFRAADRVSHADRRHLGEHGPIATSNVCSGGQTALAP